MDKREAMELLKKFRCPENVVEHCRIVSRYAREIAERASANVDFVEVAALLHDIGRCKTHSIKHGVVGGEILRSLGLENFARVAERHIGAGISRREAKKLGLQDKDYVPETLEEKIIAMADNFIIGDRIASFDEVLDFFEGKFGKDSEVVQRIKDLYQELKEFL